MLRLVAALAVVQPGGGEHGESDGGEAGGVVVGEEGGEEARGEGHIDDGDGEDARRRVRFVMLAGAVGVLDEGEKEGCYGNQRRGPFWRQGEERQGNSGAVGGDGAAALANGFPGRHGFARVLPPAEDVGAAAGGDDEGNAERALQQGFAVGGEAVGGDEDEQGEGSEGESGLARGRVREAQAEVVHGAGFEQPDGGRPGERQEEQRQGEGYQDGSEEGRGEQVALPVGAVLAVAVRGGEEDGAAAGGGNQRRAQ